MLGFYCVCVNTKPCKAGHRYMETGLVEITWIEQQANGIEVEETEISQEEFDRLFGDDPETRPVNH